MSPRTIVYVDGFNLYYGAVKDTPYKWLNIEKYFHRLRRHDEIIQIHYFTAMIDVATRQNQRIYLRALETLPKVSITLGRFKDKEIVCKVKECDYLGSKKFLRPEEKRTDVAIGVQMLDDAYQDRCDNSVLVTGDSDLVPAVQMLKANFPQKKVILYIPSRNPKRGAAVELRSVVDRARILPFNLIERSQFPQRINDGFGGFIEKPGEW